MAPRAARRDRWFAAPLSWTAIAEEEKQGHRAENSFAKLALGLHVSLASHHIVVEFDSVWEARRELICQFSLTTVAHSWACGAAGSALPWHGRGRRFDPDQVHQILPQYLRGFPVHQHFPRIAHFGRLSQNCHKPH